MAAGANDGPVGAVTKAKDAHLATLLALFDAVDAHDAVDGGAAMTVQELTDGARWLGWFSGAFLASGAWFSILSMTGSAWWLAGSAPCTGLGWLFDRWARKAVQEVTQ